MEILTRAQKAAPWRGMLALLVLAAVLSAVLTAVLVAAHHPEALAKQHFSLAELRRIKEVRAQRNTGQPKALAGAARTYLKNFPDGRYADEALLALGGAEERLLATDAALAAYSRLIEHHPESPFREQAMAESIPLLMQTGKAKQAGRMAEGLLKRYPRSIHRDRILLWRARSKFQAGAFAESQEILERIKPRNLPPGNQTEFYRLAGWTYRETGQPGKSWPMFALYVKREDTAERKAPVLMMLGGALEEGGKPGEALALYTEVIERHPHPEHLPEALFRRAETFESAMFGPAPPDRRGALRVEAIGYYSAYLQSGEPRHEEGALRRRAPLLKAEGRKEDALRDFQRLAELNKSPRVDRALLVEIVELLGEVGRGTEGAALLIREIENSATPQQERAVLKVELAALYYRAEDCKKVVNGLRPLPVFREAKHRQRATFLRGFCFHRMKQWERASWDLEAVVKEPEYFELAWPALIQAYEKSGQHARLANLSEQFLNSKQVEPTAALLRSMAEAYGKLGQPNRMLSAIRRLEAIEPDAVQSADMQFQLGRGEEAVGNLDKAEAHYLAALENKAGEGRFAEASLGALTQLQSIYLNESRYEELAKLNGEAAKAAAATKKGKHAKRIATLQAIAYLRWGQALSEAGDAKAAGKKINQAWAQIPGGFSTQRLEILNTVAGTYAARNRYAAARKLYAKELKRAKRKKDKARILAALGGLYLAWAEATEKKGPSTKTAARYEKALALLPPERWRERYQAAVRLDALYRKSGDFKARARIFDGLAPTLPPPDLREQLRVYRVRIYKDWARATAAGGKTITAGRLLKKGGKLVKEEEWRLQYELLAVRGEILLKQKNYSELLIRYEKFLPSIRDPALKQQVDNFLGQIYLAWAQAASKARNLKSTRIRARRALDYLPASDWQRRLAAANLLNPVLDKAKRPEDAAEIYEALIPTITDSEVRRKYAIFLGRKYLRQLNNPQAAAGWLKQGDLGENDPLSLEAVYLAAEVKLLGDDKDDAIDLLEGLTGRDISKSRWLVPIHSRLAVLYHEGNEMKKALANYRVVAKVKSKELLRLYPKSIGVAREQVRAIRAYLRFKGGSGPKVAVPKVSR